MILNCHKDNIKQVTCSLSLQLYIYVHIYVQDHFLGKVGLQVNQKGN